MGLLSSYSHKYISILHSSSLGFLLEESKKTEDEKTQEVSKDPPPDAKAVLEKSGDASKASSKMGPRLLFKKKTEGFSNSQLLIERVDNFFPTEFCEHTMPDNSIFLADLW